VWKKSFLEGTAGVFGEDFRTFYNFLEEPPTTSQLPIGKNLKSRQLSREKLEHD